MDQAQVGGEKNGRRIVFFEPHADDLVLFAFYSLLEVFPREATVVTVLGDDTARSRETKNALSTLDRQVEYVPWTISESKPDWREVESRMRVLRYDLGNHVLAYAPAHEDGGHEHHNAVAKLVQEVFEEDCVFYLTYRRGYGRSRSDSEVEPRPGWKAKKFAALACYPSQIERDDTRPWFCSDDALREWVL